MFATKNFLNSLKKYDLKKIFNINIFKPIVYIRNAGNTCEILDKKPLNKGKGNMRGRVTLRAARTTNTDPYSNTNINPDLGNEKLTYHKIPENLPHDIYSNTAPFKKVIVQQSHTLPKNSTEKGRKKNKDKRRKGRSSESDLQSGDYLGRREKFQDADQHNEEIYIGSRTNLNRLRKTHVVCDHRTDYLNCSHNNHATETSYAAVEGPITATPNDSFINPNEKDGKVIKNGNIINKGISKKHYSTRINLDKYNSFDDKKIDDIHESIDTNIKITDRENLKRKISLSSPNIKNNVDFKKKSMKDKSKTIPPISIRPMKDMPINQKK